MPKNLTDEEIEEATERLTIKENEVFQKFVNSTEQPLDPASQAKIFTRYMSGQTTHVISQDKSLGVTWGQIIHAKVMGEWDDKLREHTETMLTDTVSKVQRVNLESVNAIAGYLEAINKDIEARVSIARATGDSTTLQQIPLKDYAQAQQVLKSLTSQAGQQSKQQQALGAHKGPKKKKLVISATSTVPSSDEAAEAMQRLLEAKK